MFIILNDDLMKTDNYGTGMFFRRSGTRLHLHLRSPSVICKANAALWSIDRLSVKENYCRLRKSEGCESQR